MIKHNLGYLTGVSLAVCTVIAQFVSGAILPFKPQSVLAQSGPTCSNETLKGTYGHHATGFRLVNGVSTPFDAVRTAVFNGQGNVTGHGFYSLGGNITEYKITGGYKVEKDCTVIFEHSIVTTDGKPSQVSKQFGVIVGGGDRVLYVQLNAGRNESGVYERVK